MHRLAEIAIHNFRSIRDGTFALADYTPIVGPNNSGKSNLLAAIRWLLRASSLSEADFNDRNAAIIVSGTIIGICPDVLECLVPEHRERIAPFCEGGRLRLRRTQPVPSSPANRLTLDVLRPGADENAPESWARNPTGIDAAIKRIFPEPIEIGAMQNVPEDVAKTKSGTTIGKLIAEITEPVEQQHGAAIREALEGVKRRLEAEGEDRAPELQRIDSGANEKLQDLFSGIRVRIHIPTPQVKELFKGGTIKVFEGDDPTGRDVEALGHGAQRAIQMALIRYLAELRSAGNEAASRTLLLIEEPELYMHPQGIEQIRSALRTLSQGQYQVVFSTHSPLLIGQIDLGDTLVIQKPVERGTEARPRLKDAVAEVIADLPSQAAILFDFGNAGQVLFSSTVVLAEGTTEQRLLPLIFRLETGRSLGAARIGLVTPGGVGNIPNGLRILEVMGIPAKAVTDLDFAFRQAVRSGLLTVDDPALEASRPLFQQLAADRGIVLAEDGFPRNGNGYTAAEGFAFFAGLPPAQAIIDQLHRRLREQRIWLWKKGTLEAHLGLGGGGETTWGRFAVELEQQGSQARIADHAGVKCLVDWIQDQ